MNQKFLILLSVIITFILVAGLVALILFFAIFNGSDRDYSYRYCSNYYPENCFPYIVISGNSSLSNPATVAIEQFLPGYCQVRLDFVDFYLGDVDSDGICLGGLVIGGHYNSNGVPAIICGENSGQHIYLNFYDDTPIIVGIISQYRDEYWNIVATYIPCNDEIITAPLDCLQYFTEQNGTVSSFNFQNVDKVSRRPEQYQLSGLNYSICIGSYDNSFSNITWTKGLDTTNYYFVLSEKIEMIPDEIVGSLEAAEFDTECTGPESSYDFVEIKNGQFTNLNGTVETKNQYCGAGFPHLVTSSMKPFRLRMISNWEEEDHEDSIGFSLSYTLS